MTIAFWRREWPGVLTVAIIGPLSLRYQRHAHVGRTYEQTNHHWHLCWRAPRVIGLEVITRRYPKEPR